MTKGKLLSLLGASCVVAFAASAPAEAAAKPCCYYGNGTYRNASVSTCRKNGRQIVEQRFCYAGAYGPNRGGDVSFSISLGGVVIAYSDGYYDGSRRWHRWNNDRERDWYRDHHKSQYHHMRRDDDHDRRRRDWRDGRRNDWR
jgi:hypothetical protein